MDGGLCGRCPAWNDPSRGEIMGDLIQFVIIFFGVSIDLMFKGSADSLHRSSFTKPPNSKFLYYLHALILHQTFSGQTFL
jgi:hypothetical protein